MLKRQPRQGDGTGVCFPALRVPCFSSFPLSHLPPPPAGPSRFLILLAEHIGTAYSSHIVCTCLYIGHPFLSYPPCPSANANPHRGGDWLGQPYPSQSSLKQNSGLTSVIPAVIKKKNNGQKKMTKSALGLLQSCCHLLLWAVLPSNSLEQTFQILIPNPQVAQQSTRLLFMRGSLWVCLTASWSHPTGKPWADVTSQVSALKNLGDFLLLSPRPMWWPPLSSFLPAQVTCAPASWNRTCSHLDQHPEGLSLPAFVDTLTSCQMGGISSISLLPGLAHLLDLCSVTLSQLFMIQLGAITPSSRFLLGNNYFLWHVTF